MKITKVSDIKKIETIWNELYSNLENKLTPFQSFSANLDLYNSWYFKPSRWHLKPVFVLIWNGKKCIGIIPCCESKNKVYDFCSQSPIDYYDWLLSPNCQNSEIEFIFQSLKTLFPNKSFLLRRIRKTSPLYDFFSKKSDVIFGEDEICGSELDCSNYENWYNSLSKHMRQNLRTAYNKIKKENKEIKLHVYNNENWNENIYYKSCIKFYEERCCTKNKQSFSKIRDFLRHKYNPLETTLQEHNQRVMFILSIDNKPAAFFSGFMSNQILYVPRLSMNEQYAKYDTVTLLVAESIKYLNNPPPTHTPHTSCYQIDFTRGGEPYKFKLGAKETYVYKALF